MLNIGNSLEDSPCRTEPVLLSNLSSRVAASPSALTGLYQLRVLWQNAAGYGFFDCIKYLSNMTSIDIAPQNVFQSPIKIMYT